MTARSAAIKVPRQVGRVLPAGLFGHRPWRVIERNGLAYRRMWVVFLSGFLEPLLYLLSIGIGVGKLVGVLAGPGGHAVTYQVYVAPGLLAASAMNGSALDTTFNFFVKFKYAHTYDAMLATPLGVRDLARGEVGWALLRGSVYAAAFLGTMAGLGLTPSWWSILAMPGAVLIGYAFAGAGLGASTWMRSYVDFDYVNMVLITSFLFSATFFPLSSYPSALAWIVRLTPLYQGVAMERALCLGHPGPVLIVHAAYLAVLGYVGVALAARRLRRLLQP
ncbi:MAG: ABC transporter permease [Acidimicrobiales bacterium]